MKVLHEKKTNRKQLLTTFILIVVIAGLAGGMYLIRQRLDIRERAAGPSCSLYDGVCSWVPVPGVTNYRIVVTGSDGETQEFTSAGSSITFAGKPATSYTCRVTAIEYSNADCKNLPSGEATGFCPVDSSTEGGKLTPTVIATPSASITPSSLSVTPAVTPPIGGQADPTPTIRAGSTATPTPTDIVIQKSPTITPTIIPSSTQVTGTITSAPTTVTSLPQSGLWKPSLIIIGVGLLTILIPLFL